MYFLLIRYLDVTYSLSRNGASIAGGRAFVLRSGKRFLDATNVACIAMCNHGCVYHLASAAARRYIVYL